MTFTEAKHLRQLDIVPQHISGWFVQYDNIYQRPDEFEYWDLALKEYNDENTDYGYSNPMFFPDCPYDEYVKLIDGKDQYDANKITNGIPDYLMDKYFNGD